MVPKFGDWDESNPASAEGYTHMFEKVREEKQIGAGKVPAMATESPYSNGQSQCRNANPKVRMICTLGSFLELDSPPAASVDEGYGEN